MADSPEAVKAEVRKYMMVFAALMVLTFVTVAVSYIHLSITPAVILALFIAMIKASLVGGYFMHLISERQAIYALLIFTVFFFLGLMILPLLQTGDPKVGG